MNRFAKPYYQAYLMRFWEEQKSDEIHPSVWRFILEDPHNGERRGFSSLEALTAFLATLIEEARS